MPTEPTLQMSDADADAYFARLRAKIDARNEEAARLAAPGKPVRFAYPTRGQRALAQLDMAGDDVARLTTFDDLGPIGHMCFRSLAEAIADALQQGAQVE